METSPAVSRSSCPKFRARGERTARAGCVIYDSANWGEKKVRALANDY